MPKSMFTFGVLTGKANIDAVIQSILRQKIPEYEIIIVGPCDYSFDFCHNNKIRIIHDRLCEEKQWITRKKNIVIENATGDIIVFMKDYILLSQNWYKGYLLYHETHGSSWDILMNKLKNRSNKRLLDWVWLNPKKQGPRHISYNLQNHPCMYVPGNFMIAKTAFMKVHNFDESLVGLRRQSDVYWSQQHLHEATYTMNVHSKCILIKKENWNLQLRKPCKCELCVLSLQNKSSH